MAVTPIVAKGWTARLKTGAAAVSFGMMLALAGCGGGGSSDSPTPAPTPATPSKVSFSSRTDAARMLTQATFGPSATDIDTALRTTAQDWLIRQINMSPTLHADATIAFMDSYPEGEDELWIEAQYPSVSEWNAMFDAPDQLRQRMAFALSQIMVVSAPLSSENFYDPIGMAYHMDLMSEGAFGNYRDLMGDITRSAVMARFLTFMKNQKEDPETGQVPDENYARELLQLFTIGLYELNMDGSLKTSGGSPIETYDNDDIRGLAKVFTGLAYDTDRFFFLKESLTPAVRTSPLKMFDRFHSTSEKAFLNTVIPEGTTGDESIELALDAIFAHANVAPFVSRQLIQRLVTSNPSPAYVERVATAFEQGSYRFPDGTVVGESRRGDLAATICAILMDTEARSATAAVSNDFGKIREPVLRLTHWVRAFNAQDRNVFNEVLLVDTSSPEYLGQHPYRSPSVFNFYRPGFVAPGSNSGEAGLVAPELQLVNEFSFVSLINFMSYFVRDETWLWEEGADTGFRPVYDAEVKLANDIPALVSRLEDILIPGGLETDTRDRIEAILAEIPIRVDVVDTPDENEETTDRLTRVQAGAILVMTSPEYVVQR